MSYHRIVKGEFDKATACFHISGGDNEQGDEKRCTSAKGDPDIGVMKGEPLVHCYVAGGCSVVRSDPLGALWAWGEV